MLKALDPLLTPDLLHALAAMGHGDEIAIVDGNFPAASCAQRLVLLPGVDATRTLDAVLSVLPLDDFVATPFATMAVVDKPDEVPAAVGDFTGRVRAEPGFGQSRAETLARDAFYQRARGAFAIVQTGDTRLYANVLLRKGVIRAD